MDEGTGCPIKAGFDFTDPDLHAAGSPLREYALLRKTAPVWWNEQRTGTCSYNDGGFWVISKHEHVKAISRDPELWSSYVNTSQVRLPDYMTAEQIDLTRTMLINQDPPSHSRLRRLVSRMFTPRSVAAMEGKLSKAAYRIVGAAAQKDDGDFVADVASRLPVAAIADLIGVPACDREMLAAWTNSMINSDDPDAVEAPEVAHANIVAYAYAMAEDRRKNPSDDIITRLVTPGPDGESLSEIEFGFFVTLLAIGGVETTRNAITFGIDELLSRPEQWELFKLDRPHTATDEVIRWATPIQVFQRTATRDTEIDGVVIKAGQRVGLFYGSANFDEDVFDEPHSFNILRNPNPHLSFGGSGTHYCIGANLARMEVRLMLNAIADVLPDIQRTAPMKLVRSSFVHGAKALPVRYHARAGRAPTSV